MLKILLLTMNGLISRKKELIKSNIDNQDMGDKIIIGFHYKIDY